jgi:hypothetical protein
VLDAPAACSFFRQLGQLLVRGDCVVCVSAASKDEQPPSALEAFRKLAARAARRAIVAHDVDGSADWSGRTPGVEVKQEDPALAAGSTLCADAANTERAEAVDPRLRGSSDPRQMTSMTSGSEWRSRDVWDGLSDSCDETDDKEDARGGSRHS